MNSCRQCGGTFSRRWNLDRHIAYSHPKLSSVKTVEEDTYSGLGRGVNQQLDPPSDMESSENIESENELDYENAQGRRNIFKRSMDEESDSESFENPSSDDSDDCESSSEYSSENDEEGTNDGSPDEEIAESEEKGPQKPHNLSYARWRDVDNGVYTGWKSFNKKPHVVQHREWLNKLLETPCKLQKALIMEATESQLDVFREIAMNVLQGRTAMPYRTLKGLGKYKAPIRKLGSENSDYYTLRRTLLAGRVDILPLLLLNATPSCIKSRKVGRTSDGSDKSEDYMR